RPREQAILSIHLDAVIGAGLLLLAAALYLKTAAPGVYSFDAAEFTIAAATWGIPHASGYPLFVLLGRLFIQVLPLGDAAYRMVVMTALFAALSVAVLYALLRQLQVSRVASAAAAAAFAVSYYQWSTAVVTKEHSLHDLLLIMVLWLLVRWQRSAGFRWLLAATVIYGLSLTNHLAAALYAPALLAFVIWQGRRTGTLGVGQWLALTAGGAVSLLPYLYLPLAYLGQPALNIAGHFDRNGAFHAENLATWQGFIWMLSSRQFAGSILGSSLSSLPLQVWELARWWWGNFFGVGVVLGIVGLKTFYSRNRAFFCLALAVAALHAAFFVTYAVPDRYSMFTPVYLLWTIPLAFGLDWALVSLPANGARRWIAGLMVVGILGGLAANYRLLDLSHDERPRDWALSLLSRVPPNSIVLARWAFSGPLRYEQLLGGLRPDVQVIDVFLISRQDVKDLVEQYVDGKTLIVDDVSLFNAAELPGICARLLPGPQVTLDRSLENGAEPGSYPGYQLVRCQPR
ncbi:MAG TPA: DUF2723 domain-containing protein, partial [Chloroflexota bacterium]|nr:DUF2723 domain-containing protein [Chloroflexota bacterium]